MKKKHEKRTRFDSQKTRTKQAWLGKSCQLFKKPAHPDKLVVFSKNQKICPDFVPKLIKHKTFKYIKQDTAGFAAVIKLSE